MEKANIAIHGMSCGGCVNKVTAALKALPGVTVGKVAVGSATVTFDPSTAPPDRLIQAIGAIGFRAEVIPPSAHVSAAQ